MIQKTLTKSRNVIWVDINKGFSNSHPCSDDYPVIWYRSSQLNHNLCDNDEILRSMG